MPCAPPSTPPWCQPCAPPAPQHRYRKGAATVVPTQNIVALAISKIFLPPVVAVFLPGGKRPCRAASQRRKRRSEWWQRRLAAVLCGGMGEGQLFNEHRKTQRVRATEFTAPGESPPFAARAPPSLCLVTARSVARKMVAAAPRCGAMARNGSVGRIQLTPLNSTRERAGIHRTGRNAAFRHAQATELVPRHSAVHGAQDGGGGDLLRRCAAEWERGQNSNSLDLFGSRKSCCRLLALGASAVRLLLLLCTLPPVVMKA